MSLKPAIIDTATLSYAMWQVNGILSDVVDDLRNKHMFGLHNMPIDISVLGIEVVPPRLDTQIALMKINIGLTVMFGNIAWITISLGEEDGISFRKFDSDYVREKLITDFDREINIQISEWISQREGDDND